jgi:4-oxalocrotonate tautomerase
MPIVTIEMLEGRSARQKASLYEDITAAFVKHAGSSREDVRIIIREFQPESYAVGGVAFADLRRRT